MGKSMDNVLRRVSLHLLFIIHNALSIIAYVPHSV